LRAVLAPFSARIDLCAEEAAIGAIERWGTAEDAAMTRDRGRHVDFVHRVAFENLIPGDQSCGAFGEKHLVAEVDRRAHLAPFDQVGVRLEDRINLFRCRHLFALEHAARLVDDARAERAIMRDLFAQGLDVQGGYRQALGERPRRRLAAGRSGRVAFRRGTGLIIVKSCRDHRLPLFVFDTIVTARGAMAARKHHAENVRKVAEQAMGDAIEITVLTDLIEGQNTNGINRYYPGCTG
jgi:hypothetical protein